MLMESIKIPEPIWSISVNEMLEKCATTKNGLTGNEAARRLSRHGTNSLKPNKRINTLILLVTQFKSPIVLILFCATGLSFFLGDPVNAGIILSIILVSGMLGFLQERGAANAVEKLNSIVQIKTVVVRDGKSEEIPVEKIVPGDIVILKAGDIVPGDGLINEAEDLFVDEAMLTGESFPANKSVAVLPPETPMAKRTNVLWMGTHIVSGSVHALIVRTGKETEFGKLSERLKLRPPETEFERGIRQFGFFLLEITMVLVVAIFAINVYLARPVVESMLFSLALAVGLTPQLLPVIISINLSHGAKRMVRKKVIVKRLASIENFGSMNVICCDKTGTLTEGIVNVQSACDVKGAPSDKVLLHAYINAFYETGFTNPVDEAIRNHRRFDLSEYSKLDEIPYDFLRKRLSILVSHNKTNLMVTKGALLNVLDACSSAEMNDKIVDIDIVHDQIRQHFEDFSAKGYRTLGVAYKNILIDRRISQFHETGLTFSGFLVLFDQPKHDLAATIADLEKLGVAIKIITGDNKLVAATVSRLVGLTDTNIITGADLHLLSDEALMRRISDIEVFAEIEPNQKERIVLTLKKAGNVVGYMGDGINDISALHAADVSISVAGAAEVAKDAADIVLLEKDLGVLANGILEGRLTFANTLKYVLMATSSNFGNMFSMAGLSLFLPFLPLLPKQILLMNLMTDLPEMTISTDNVDKEMVDFPRRWDIKAIRKFMFTFGIVSSVFDYLTFGTLLFALQATHIQFRTAWFLESVASASLIVLVIRSRKPLLRSRPGKYLLMSTLVILIVTAVLSYVPFASIFGFGPLPPSFLLLIGIIVMFYIITAEITKRIFFKMVYL